MGVEVQVMEEDKSKKWDELVEASPQGTIFHTWKWLKIMEKHTKSKLYPLIGLKGTTPIGVFPLFFQKKKFLKMIFSPPPHSAAPFLGPAFVNYHILKQNKKESTFVDFQKQVDEFIFDEIKPNYVSIFLSDKLVDSRPFMWTGYDVKPFYTYVMDLSNGKDFVWSKFARNLRAHINKAQKNDLYVEESSIRGLQFIYDSIAKRYEEQGRAFKVEKNYLLDLYDSFYPRNLRIFIAKYHEEPIGGIIAIIYKDRISFWLGAAKAKSQHGSPNDFLQWKIIEWACEQGLKYYEEIGANTYRLCQFKSKYNPDLRVFFWARKYSPSFVKILENFYRKYRN